MKKAGTIYLYCTSLFLFGQAFYSAYKYNLGVDGWIGHIVGGLALFIIARKTRNL